jgi:hypothetical protein
MLVVPENICTRCRMCPQSRNKVCIDIVPDVRAPGENIRYEIKLFTLSIIPDGCQGSHMFKLQSSCKITGHFDHGSYAVQALYVMFLYSQVTLDHPPLQIMLPIHLIRDARGSCKDIMHLYKQVPWPLACATTSQASVSV